jgi:4-amino-4-deoxy-L-arabinose transferase-like glycosyltransferase
MATSVETVRSAAHSRLTWAVALGRWSATAWAAIGVCVLFIAITFWWLAHDRSIPIYDSGLHLLYAFDVRSALGAGNFGAAFKSTLPYPPFTYVIGSLGVFVGGIGVAPPILAQNLIFVPLLGLGCYQLGRLAFGPLAGLLAVVFALGSPLIIPQFHVFMVDAPETAMVAVAIWLIIASEGFARVPVSALAGLAVGVGLLVKEPFAFFVAGPLIVTAVRGARRARRGERSVWLGFAAFCVVALIVALPWYAAEFSSIRATESTAINAANHSSATTPVVNYEADIAPARFSLDNFEWYFWNLLNFQLFLPLFLLSAAGWLWMVLRLLRRRPAGRCAPELLLGSFIAWFAITETFVHDTRYSLPLQVYLAVIGTGWILQLPRTGRIAASAAVVLVALANTFATSFGVGDTVLAATGPSDALGHATTLQHAGQIVVYNPGGFLVAGPKRDGDMLGMLRALERQGVTGVTWSAEQATEQDFTDIGVTVLSKIAGLAILEHLAAPTPVGSLTKRDAIFAHGPVKPGESPPCVTLSDGTGVWVRLGNPYAHGEQDYCPLPTPRFYGPKQP